GAVSAGDDEAAGPLELVGAGPVGAPPAARRWLRRACDPPEQRLVEGHGIPSPSATCRRLDRFFDFAAGRRLRYRSNSFFWGGRKTSPCSSMTRAPLGSCRSRRASRSG